MWFRRSFGHPDRPAHLGRWTRLCQNARQKRPGAEGLSSQAVAMLRCGVDKVRRCETDQKGESLTCSRTSCAEGIPPLAESFFDGDERDREDMIPCLPVDLQFLHKVYIILLRAIVAMEKTNLQSIRCDVRVLRSLISIFDSQLLSLAPSAPSDLGEFGCPCTSIVPDCDRHVATKLRSYPRDGFPLLRSSYES